MSPEQRNDDLRLDYNETTDLMRGLTDVRFKLVAFVPTISGAAIAVLGRGKSTTSELLAVGLLGLVATVGIVIFDLRNTQLLDYAVLRAKSLEERLGLRLDLRARVAGWAVHRAPGPRSASVRARRGRPRPRAGARLQRGDRRLVLHRCVGSAARARRRGRPPAGRRDRAHRSGRRPDRVRPDRRSARTGMCRVASRAAAPDVA